MTLPSCGIYRERPHSPGRVDDDAAIMDAVAAALVERGFPVDLVPAEAALPAFGRPHCGIFAMCEQDAILANLAQLESGGIPVVNSAAAIRNTYRLRTAQLFADADVPAPASWVVEIAAGEDSPAPEVWVKRADFHATQADDVLFAAGPEQWRSVLTRFAARGLATAVVQAHVPGDLVKFYGVLGCPGQPDWFNWFYHADQQLAGHRFAEPRLQAAAFRAAHALGVEVFGGDAIIDSAGGAWVIDLNAWPSFARCRSAAAQAIASRLAYRFAPEETIPPSFHPMTREQA